MNYDVVIIGSGLAALSAALKVVKEGKKTLIVAKGMGNLYSASGFIDLLGFYPSTASKYAENPLKLLDTLLEEDTNHPYSLIGKDLIKEAFTTFLEASSEMGMPYQGSVDYNMVFPSTIGTLIPTCLYPSTNAKKILDAENILVVGIEELCDFYPDLTACNLKSNLDSNIQAISVPLDLDFTRNCNSFDLAVFFEQPKIQEKFINNIRPYVTPNHLLLLPATLGLENHKQIVANIEENLNCQVLEIPTLPPSVMGYRLAEAFQKYLKNLGVEFIIGNTVTGFKKELDKCREISLISVNKRELTIKGDYYILATGGILGEGLKVYPEELRETVFDLPVVYLDQEKKIVADFFNLEGQPYSRAGVKVNSSLQPIDKISKQVIFSNVFIAGATIAGYDPFSEKSGNGVALTTGYKAGSMVMQGEINDE